MQNNRLDEDCSCFISSRHDIYLCESGVALCTLIWPLTSVNPLMFPQFVTRYKSLITVGALVWFVAGVNPLMNLRRDSTFCIVTHNTELLLRKSNLLFQINCCFYRFKEYLPQVAPLELNPLPQIRHVCLHFPS